MNSDIFFKEAVCNLIYSSIPTYCDNFFISFFYKISCKICSITQFFSKGNFTVIAKKPFNHQMKVVPIYTSQSTRRIWINYYGGFSPFSILAYHIKVYDGVSIE